MEKQRDRGMEELRTCLIHCSRSLVCWMCLSIEFILAVELHPRAMNMPSLWGEEG